MTTLEAVESRCRRKALGRETVVLHDQNRVHTFPKCDREKGYTGQCSYNGPVEGFSVTTMKGVLS